MAYVDVVFPLALKRPLTYAVPEGVVVKEGCYVEAPMGRKKRIGVVWAVYDTAPEGIVTFKPIAAVLTVSPMPKSLRTLMSWLADYTVSALGSVVKLAGIADATLTKEIKETAYYQLGSLDNHTLTSARQKVVTYLQDSSADTLPHMIERAGVSRAVLNKMIAEEMLVAAPAPSSQLLSQSKPVILSEDQHHVFTQLWQHYAAENYATILLDGVTGSGKTEVYFKVIEQLLLDDPTSQIVILLPEIILTSQLEARFTRCFGFAPTLWHSALTPNQRIKNWRAIANGTARLVVGARSALLLPYTNLKTIIVDEEHDSSYKQEDGVIYHARDAAVMRAHIENIPIILASATPSIETMLNCQNQKYHHLKLLKRHGGAVFPELRIIDMCQEPLDAGHWISQPLAKALAANIANGNQSIVFLNRRGYAPLVLCRNCGHRFACKECSSWLVMHKSQANLQCHHCGYSEPLPQECPECGEQETLAMCGPGVERIHEEITQLLPHARTLVMTSDMMHTASQASEAIDSIINHEVDIIIGTQLIAKGHHFPKLTLVGVVDADLGLAGGDLRASERTYQLLHQVAGRAGREKDPGLVMLQSYAPENTVLSALKEGKRSEFIQFELAARKQAHMPPYSRLAGIIISSTHRDQAQAVAQQLVRSARIDPNYMRLLGPVEAPLFMLRGHYRYRILLRTKREYQIQKWITQWLESIVIPSTVKIKVDIDPHAFF